MKNILKFDAASNIKQVSFCVFRGNTFKQFLVTDLSENMSFTFCAFDFEQKLIDINTFDKCTFMNSTAPTNDIRTKGNAWSCLSSLDPVNRSFGLALEYKILIGVGSFLVVVFIVSIIVIIRIRRTRGYTNSKELFFTDEYFRAFVNEK